MLTLDDVDQILSTMRLRAGDVRIAQWGGLAPRSGYCGTPDGEDEVDLDRVYTLFGQGETIILQHLERWWQPLRELCSDLGGVFGVPAQANVYITPPASRGFAQHYDNHDVLILQVAGAKNWRVVASARELPLHDEPYLADVEERGETAFSTELTMGDTLYLPRGWLHEGDAQRQISVHVTVGVFPPLWVDLMKEAVAAAATEDVNLRKSLPLGAATIRGPEPPLREQFERLVQTMGTAETLTRALRRLRARSISIDLPMLTGHLHAFQQDPPVTLTTTVARRIVAFEVHRDDDDLVLSFRRRTLRMPSYVHPDLAFIAEASTFQAESLPGDLDDEGKLVLVRRLLKEGFLMRITEEPTRGARRF